jgi:hypothetical protein
LNDADANKIFNAVGPELIRPDLNKTAMIRGINLCIKWYGEARTFSTNKWEKGRVRCLELIYKRAKGLDVLLAREDSLLALGAPPTLFRIYIQQLITIVEHSLKSKGTEPFYKDSFKVRSPFEWLVAHFLPNVFMLLNIAPISD